MTAAIRLIALPAPAAPVKPRDPLAEQAARLWPDSGRNQREWIRAVRVVRSTRRGWLLDQLIQRGQA